MNSGKTNLKELLKTLNPVHNPGEFVFCTVEDLSKLNAADVIMTFKEQEGITVILNKEIADKLKLSYSFIASWITLTVHSSLAAVGLTAAFSKALTEKNISCNVVAAYYHDHIFVDKKDTSEAMNILTGLTK